MLGFPVDPCKIVFNLNYLDYEASFLMILKCTHAIQCEHLRLVFLN